VTTLKVFRPATAFNDATSTVEDVTSSILIDVMNNDANADGLEIVEIFGGIGTTSTTTVGATTVVSYLPAPDFHGEDRFIYRISDGHASSSAGVTVTVQPVNDEPKAAADSATTSFRTPVVVDVLANDSDIDNDPLRISTFGQGLNGSVTTSAILIEGRRALLFTPDVDFVGVDFFSYTVSDSSGATDSATATVLVTPSSPPTANADTATTSEDFSVEIKALSNDTDPDGDVLRLLEMPTGASLGSIATTSQDSIIYNPDANVYGTDSFVCTITDDRGGISSSTVTVIIHPVNDLPTARQDSGRTRVNTPLVIDVLANDSDVEDRVLRVSLVGVKTPHGLVSTTTKNGHDAALYEPDFGFFGSDVFWYTITDTDGGSASAQVSMDVTSNRPPQAINDTATTSVGQAVVIDVVSNDVDPDGDPLTLTQVFNPQHGTLATTTHTPNRVIFSPSASFVGYGSFEYTIGDGRHDFDTAVATVAVGVNLPPVAKPDSATASPGATISIDVLANDSDPNGDTLTIGSYTPPPLGSVQLVASSTLNYTAPLGNNLEEAFRYTVSDGRGGSANATVTIQVIKNDVPLEILPSHAIVPFGGEFDLVVWANVASTQQVSGVELFLDFDSSKLQVVSGSTATGSPIKVTGITTYLNLELHNSADNSSGTVDYAAGSLGPFPVGPFPVVRVRFKAVGVSNSTGTPITINLTGPRNSNVALGENVIKGEHSDAQVVVQLPRFKANVRLQGQLRPAPEGWQVPISVALFVPGTATSTSPPVSQCDTVATYSDSGLPDHPTTGTQAAEFECDGVAGIFDVVVDSTHTLPKLIRNVAIPSTQGTLHFGTLFEGDVDDSGLVDVLDFTRLVASFLECGGDDNFDVGADFDRNGCVRILDFTLLADVFQKHWAEL
jgi:hypothetical protein